MRFSGERSSRSGSCVALGVFFVLLVPLLAPASASAQPACSTADLGGTVFRDFDADGTRDPLEGPVSGVTVRVFDAAGAQVASGTSALDGTYVLAGAAGALPLRLELDLASLPPAFRSGPFGGGSGTTVQFARAQACDFDLGVHVPAQFCQTDPVLVTACYINGDPLGGGTAGTADAVVSFPYVPAGDRTPAPGHLATTAEVGATWGLAYQRSSQTLFAGAMLKRHVGLGPLGPGGLYTVDLSGAPVVSPFVDLATLGVAPGANPRTSPGDPGLPADLSDPNHDPNVWDAVGKVALGDLDLSEDERTLWVMSLGDRTLYEIFVDRPAQVPTAADVTAHPVPDPGCSDGEYRPWAVKVHDGQVLVGVVCSAETSQQVSDLHAHVLALDPANPGAGFSSIFDFPLDYPRGCVSVSGGNCADAEWLPWIDEFADIPNPRRVFSQTIHPQPVLADLEVDTDGSLLLGFFDRLGHQMGNANFSTDPLDTTTYEAAVAGDLLRACRDDGAFTLESAGGCPGRPATDGAGNSQGPGGGEYYWSDMFSSSSDPTAGTHNEITIGGLAHVLGTGEVVSTVFDPVDIRSGGAVWLDHASGDDNDRYEIFGQDALGQPATFGKAAGLGDLEALCDPAPLEIGNRIWRDEDGDGVQDPGEPVLPGVTVRLFCDGAPSPVASTTTDARGTYYFHDGNVPGGLTPGDSCLVRLDEPGDFSGGPLTDLVPTTPNQGTNLHDSDCTLVGGFPEVAVSLEDPGTNDHTFDCGFVQPPPDVIATKGSSLADDVDGDGLIDPGDSLIYSVVLTNLGTGPADGVTVSDTPDPNTTLVAGSVMTTQGTVTTGNDPGDTTVAVDVGALAASGGTATVTFEVTVNDPLPQGITQIFNQATVSGSDFPDVPTDDPATGDPDDPTNDPVDSPSILEIPTLSEIGLGLLAALLSLLGVALIRFRM